MTREPIPIPGDNRTMAKREKDSSAVRSVSAQREGVSDAKPQRLPPSYSPVGAPSHDNAGALVHAKAICSLVFGPPGTRTFSIRYWDGSLEPATHDVLPFTLVIARAGALRRMLLPPNELTIIE